jgi:hypothetical protein
MYFSYPHPDRLLKATTTMDFPLLLNEKILCYCWNWCPKLQLVGWYFDYKRINIVYSFIIIIEQWAYTFLF